MSKHAFASELLLRNQEHFFDRKVLFAGDLQDSFPTVFSAKAVKVFSTDYHYFNKLTPNLESAIEFGVEADAHFVASCDTLIYYWPKTKQEALFQLTMLLSRMPLGSKVYIVGENRSGVRSAEKLLAPLLSVEKWDNARHCSLYIGQIEAPISFELARWWRSYTIDEITVKTLPGVFSGEHLDVGSALLLSVLSDVPLKGTLLDVGCGSGVLASVIGKKNPQLTLTLSDIQAMSLTSSRATLLENKITGSVVASDGFHHITGSFDTIISNPPFHNGLQESLKATKTMVQQAASFLAPRGKLYLVANAFLPYANLLDGVFGEHQVVAQTSKFKVYCAAKKK